MNTNLLLWGPCRRVLHHAIYWLIYSCMVYIGNMLIYTKVEYCQIIFALPLFMSVFYLGYYVARKRKIWLASPLLKWGVLPGLLVFFLFCDFWVYTFLPSLGIKVSYLDQRDWNSYTLNFVQYFVRFLLYGILFYLWGIPSKLHKLESKLLRLEIIPHNMYNAWNNILMHISLGNERLKTMISGQAAIQHYAVKIGRLEKDIVPIELELAKLRSWIKTLSANIRLHVHGECQGQHILPMSTIELLQNALKYGDTDTPIELVFELAPGFVHFHIANQIADRATADSLGTGIDNLQRRLECNNHIKGQLRIAIDDNRYEVNLIIENLKKPDYEKNQNCDFG